MAEAERSIANGEGREILTFCHDTRRIGAGRSGVALVLADHVEHIAEVETEDIRLQQHIILTVSGASALNRRVCAVASRVSHRSMATARSAFRSIAVSSASLLLRKASMRRRAPREPPDSSEQGEATRATRHNARAIRAIGGT